MYLLNESYSLFEQILRRFRDTLSTLSLLMPIFFTSHGSLQDPSGTIRLRNREEHANENSRNVSIDRQIVLLINAFEQSPCIGPRATRYSILLGSKTLTSFPSMIITKNEKKKEKKKESGYFIKFIARITQCIEFRDIVFIWIGFTIR